jgi:hypothetical protein
VTAPSQPAVASDPAPQRSSRRSAALTATLLTIPIAVAAGLGTFALRGGFSDPPPETGPVAVTAPPASAAADPVCAELLNALPRTLGGQAARPVSDAPHRAAAWGDPPIVLRCGVAKPAADSKKAQQLVINGVTWVYAEQSGRAVWTAVRRAVYVEVRVPAEYSETASQRIILPLAAPLTKTVPHAS